jgi:hypothetical protein
MGVSFLETYMHAYAEQVLDREALLLTMEMNCKLNHNSKSPDPDQIIYPAPVSFNLPIYVST